MVKSFVSLMLPKIINWMKYLLDTDHLSILQRQTGDAYDNLLSQMSRECFKTLVLCTRSPQPPLIRGTSEFKVPLIKGDLGGSPRLMRW
jgi:hypothetical protein